MKISRTVAFRALNTSRRRQALSRCAWAVYAVRRDGALHAKESSAHCDEAAALAQATLMARQNPGRAYVAAPINGESPSLVREMCS